MAGTETSDAVMASLGIGAVGGSGITAIAIKLFITNTFKRFEEIVGAVNQMKEYMAGFKVQLTVVDRVERALEDLSETVVDLGHRVTYLEATSNAKKKPRP